MKHHQKTYSHLLILLYLCLLISIMSHSVAATDAAVHIVYVDKPEGDEPEAFHIRTLASVLGSEEAAKDAILYSYKNAASGFSCKLTPEQVTQLSSKNS
ncbi:hypothetical protein GIB67_026276 [Kingdonia uniflora]|uniref:Inhibitor I9 domain-containing protein n=1 Tax=Kingdonia uniflora TaxID=39325 RepID=A0A7J7LA82_9MAGN|nr:hypothetical protein GIB67_026276 [Kingdonia uniflora]